jgi:hypothetical protein
MMTCLIAASTTVVLEGPWGGFGRGEDSPPNQPRLRAVAPFTGPTSVVTWQVDGVK